MDHHVARLLRFQDAERPDGVGQISAPMPSTTPYIALHVRRGDYLLRPGRHPQMTSRYWRSAVDLVSANTSNATFLVFSDDIP